MLKLNSDKDYLYQWDLNRQLVVEEKNIKEVHFCNHTGDYSLVCDVYTVGNVRLVDVPNILLQTAYNITAYATDGVNTEFSIEIKVKPRTKPENYIYTEVQYKKGYDMGKADGLEQGYKIGYSDGVTSVPHDFKYSKTIAGVFDGAIFPENYILQLELPLVNSLRYAFRNAVGLNKIIIKGVNNNIVNMGYTFQCLFEELDITEFFATFDDFTYCFSSSTLKKICGDIDFTAANKVDNAFRNCVKLEEVRIKPETLALSISFVYSSLLTADSIQSIIDGLATVETEQTLSFASGIKTALTEQQILTIINKNWTVQ